MPQPHRRHRPAIVFRGSARGSQRKRRLADTPILEWRALLALRPNVIIEGEESDVEKTLVALTGDFRSGTCEWSTLDAASTTHSVATIIVREITRLSVADRERLNAWLDRSAPRVQLIATSSTPVFQSVESGQFAPDLYYRLNTVRILAGAA